MAAGVQMGTTDRRGHGRWRIAAPLALMAAIAWESNRALPIPLPNQSDKLAHAAAFGLLAALWSWALAPRNLSVFAAAAIAFLAAKVWGVFDEVHQSFVPGRSADVLDAAADAAGACLVLLPAVWRAAVRRPQAPRAERAG
jgi:VanZ family protein